MPTVPRVRSWVGRRTNSIFCNGRKKTGRLRVQAVIRVIVCSATWSAKAPEALVTTIGDSITVGTRQWSMPGGRRLDRLQPSLADDPLPIDGHLGMPAENVGGEDFCGNLLLRGIDDLGSRHDGGNLLQVAGLGDVAENDLRCPYCRFPTPSARPFASAHVSGHRPDCATTPIHANYVAGQCRVVHSTQYSIRCCVLGGLYLVLPSRPLWPAHSVLRMVYFAPPHGELRPGRHHGTAPTPRGGPGW